MGSVISITERKKRKEAKKKITGMQRIVLSAFAEDLMCVLNLMAMGGVENTDQLLEIQKQLLLVSEEINVIIKKKNIFEPYMGE